ncbi:hypothetical protein EHF33_18120 (plasmid) [Deinococcus psychrotolerans]|uniref:Uncharacterized protein n=1 Tax=Deinococcus psychrotolerans TaxID=2489213 RepID=A0A3G8YHU4_9DEIO|nr:hypothetical protein [Deinococcus psychrotolerans]AZI44838.1 hypothetical protein EHF33_18120 [Deinococcus psychrotolerans]
MSPRVLPRTLFILVVYIIVYAVWLLSVPVRFSPLLTQNLLFVPPFFLAAWVVWQTSRLPHIPAVRMWRWISYGLLFYGLGAALHAIYDALILPQFPSPADLAYLASLPCFAAGLAALKRERVSPMQTLSFLIDTALVILIMGDLLFRTRCPAMIPPHWPCGFRWHTR